MESEWQNDFYILYQLWHVVAWPEASFVSSSWTWIYMCDGGVVFVCQLAGVGGIPPER